MHLRPESLSLSLGCLLLLFSLNAATGQTLISGTTMGPIQYRVVIHDTVADQGTLERGIEGRLEQVNQLMSTYIETSDVSRINRAPANEWVNVDRLTLHVIRRALQFGEATQGAFDITVGPAVSLWNFGPEPASSELPSTPEIEAVCQIVGYQNIQIRDNPPSVSKRHDRTAVDLSAIAKGFAVDRVADYLSDQNLRNFLVEIGGEVFTRGHKPDGPWRIGLEEPRVNQRAISAAIDLQDKALATSGDYRNFRVIDGQRLSHTIDPSTCRPVSNRVASSSVIAPDCLTADAMATALMVMGMETGLGFCQEHQLAASVTTRGNKDDSLVTRRTADFPDLLDVDAATTDRNNAASIWPAFVGALIIFGLAVSGMAIGAILNNRPITGSCGGIAARQNVDGSSACSLCRKPVSECPERNKVAQD